MRTCLIAVLCAGAVALASCNAKATSPWGATMLDKQQIDTLLASRSMPCRTVLLEWMRMRHDSRNLWLTSDDVLDLDGQVAQLGDRGCERIIEQRALVRHMSEVTQR